ncbi:DNA repair protein RecO [Proteobacteria bacterium 005FR1]|nr:DNA repair protein RecO [Proteobacteria bacterium 005FR1]
MQVQLQPAFVLHSRAYRDTSLLVDVLTPDHGRLTVVARGQRQSRQKSRRPLQPFTPLLLSWQGRSDLKTLTAAEFDGTAVFLSGNYLFSGFYANELLMRLLPQGDANEEVFQSYRKLLSQLASGEDLEVVLRQFEFRLLDELGYGIDFSADAQTGESLIEDRLYGWMNDAGFIELERNGAQAASGFLGRDLLAIAGGDFSAPETRRTAKRLARTALAPHLGDKPLKSRELFR